MTVEDWVKILSTCGQRKKLIFVDYSDMEESKNKIHEISEFRVVEFEKIVKIILQRRESDKNEQEVQYE